MGLCNLKSPEGQAVDLAKGEFSLLTAFLSSPQRILGRDQLLDQSRAQRRGVRGVHRRADTEAEKEDRGGPG